MKTMLWKHQRWLQLSRRLAVLAWLGACLSAGSLLLAKPVLQESQEKKSAQQGTQEQLEESAKDQFEPPVRLKAGGEYIAVESPGYACPTMADVDGDGKPDLVVGQFRGGKMMFFRNVADSGQPPQFDAGQWLMTGDRPAQVPGVS